MSSGLDPDQTRQQARCSVGPDLGPNCLQRLSTNKSCPYVRVKQWLWNYAHVNSHLRESGGICQIWLICNFHFRKQSLKYGYVCVIIFINIHIHHNYSILVLVKCQVTWVKYIVKQKQTLPVYSHRIGGNRKHS